MNNNKTEEDGAGILTHGHGTLSACPRRACRYQVELATNLREVSSYTVPGFSKDSESEVDLLLLIMIIVDKRPIFTSLNVS